MARMVIRPVGVGDRVEVTLEGGARVRLPRDLWAVVAGAEDERPARDERYWSRRIAGIEVD